jgi:hypothetical protein
MISYSFFCFAFLCAFFGNVLATGTAGSLDFLEGSGQFKRKSSDKGKVEPNVPSCGSCLERINTDEVEAGTNVEQYLQYFRAALIRN